MKKKALLAISIMVLLSVTVVSTFRFFEDPASPLRVACVGDSITEKSMYTSYLQQMLGDTYSVQNFGNSGSTVTLSSYKPYMNQLQFNQSAQFQPNIVVIMLGTNDAHTYLQQYTETFDEDYTKLVTSFEDLPSQPQILIVKSPPIYNNSLGLNSTFFSDTIIPEIQDVANQQNLPTVDVYDAFGNHTDYTIDGVHPNDDGAALIASQVCNAIATPDNYFSKVLPDNYEARANEQKINTNAKQESRLAKTKICVCQKKVVLASA